ncbi:MULTISPECIES: acyl-homoserine-lactone synthase [unclassified Variovorax]|uniref:acyl-homoserine-lactone synthase n=1 Tax=unclassified Variovorax TaxID=663243 RepID=UPI003F45CF33
MNYQNWQFRDHSANGEIHLHAQRKEVKVEILTGRSDSLAPGTLHELAKYRYKIFVEKLGWKLVTAHDTELDQFDRDDTMYLLARGDAGEVIGTARLLPTVRPYLLGEVFPQLIPGEPPRDPEVWELSRFAASGDEIAASGALSQFASTKVIALLEAALRFAAAHGVHRLITVSPLGIERLLRRYGFAAHRAGPPAIVDGQPIFACWIDTALACSSPTSAPSKFATRAV